MRWRAFPLHPDTPDEGLLIRDLFAGQPVDVSQMIRGLKRKAASLGLPFGDREKTFNSRLAQELGLWAESRGRGHRFHDLAFRAYFQHGRNIAQIPVLVYLATAAGLPADDARQVLSERTFSAAVDADWQLAREREIQAVPTFLYGSQRLVGARPYETLRTLVTGAN